MKLHPLFTLHYRQPLRNTFVYLRNRHPLQYKTLVRQWLQRLIASEIKSNSY